MEDRVSDRWRDPGHGDFSQALRAGAIESRVGLVDELHFDRADIGIHWQHIFGKIGIEENSKGKRVQVKGPIPDFNRIDWQGRQTIILFDTNVSSNSQVAAARNQLALELVSRGAIVQFIDLQPEDGVNGVDDYLGKPVKLEEVIGKLRHWALNRRK